MTEELKTKQAEALAAYKLAKVAFMKTVSNENVKGDFSKWKNYCDAKAVCMRLGVRI